MTIQNYIKMSEVQIKNSKVHKFNGILTVLGGVSIQIFVGSQYIWGNIKGYVTSYFKQYDNALTLSDAFVVLPCIVITNTVLMPFAGFLVEKFHPKLVVAMGSGIALAWIFCSTFMHDFWAFVMLFGVWYGIGCSLMYLVPIKWGWQYFPNYKPIVNGVVIGAFGLGSFIFNIVSTALINPDNIKHKNGYFPKEVYTRVPNSIRVWVAWWTVLSLIGVLLISKPKQTVRIVSPIQRQERVVEEVRSQDNSERNSGEFIKENNKVQEASFASLPTVLMQESKELTMKECIMSSQFYLLFIMQFLSIFVGYFVANVFKDYGELHIDDDRYLTIVGAVAAGWAGLRFIWAFIMQKLSYKVVYSLMLITQIVCCVTIKWSVKNKLSYMITIWIMMWWEGGHFTTLPTVCGTLYGQRGYQVFSVIFVNFGLSSLAGIIVVQFLLNRVLGYYSIFLICGGMSGLSLIILWVFFDEKPLNEQYFETKYASYKDVERGKSYSTVSNIQNLIDDSTSDSGHIATDYNPKDRTSLVSRE